MTFPPAAGLARERMPFNARAAIERYQALKASAADSPPPTGSLAMEGR